MAKKFYEEEDIRDIAVAIREKNGSTDTYKVSEMGDAVRAIQSGGGTDGEDKLLDYMLLTLQEIYIDRDFKIRNNLFQQQTVLKKAEFPNATSCGSFAFTTCSKLLLVDVGVSGSITVNSFSGCHLLKVFVMRKQDDIATLGGAFSNCNNIVNGITNFLVPRSLIETYKSATNWVTYAEQFKALEDYTVDGTVTGKLDYEKLGVA